MAAALLAALLLPAGARAQNNPVNARDGAVMQALMAVITAADVKAPASPAFGVDQEMNQVRGGNESGKPLGCFCGKWITFKSGYKDLDAQTIADWTYDLHGFVASKGNNWDGSGNDLQGELVPYDDKEWLRPRLVGDT
jgi:hypothetical protein